MSLHLILPVVSAVLALAVAGCALARRPLAYADSPQQRDGRFTNARPPRPLGLKQALKLWWIFLFDKPADTRPAERFAVQPLSAEQLAAAPDGTLWRLGHSTLLMKLAGGLWLTDPVLSERASPLSWMGPARFHAPPISAQDLPALAGVILSHDHYDHLDRETVRALAAKTAAFLTPLGVGERLIAWGVDPARVRQLDWWQATQVGGLRLTATPAQHFSGRGLGDANRTLWASWVIEGSGLKLFFSGDTGYFDGFRQIGERLGPFDVSFIECGAYDHRWPDVHMQPEQTLQAHLDLGARWLLPIHNGSFDLGLHAWTQPMERITALAEARGTPLSLPEMGAAVDLRQPTAGGSWWRALH